MPEQLAGFTDWLRQNHLKGFLGEIGTPSSETGVLAMLNGIDYIELNDDVWMGWAVWAGGPWWDNPSAEDPLVIDRYHLSVNPISDGSTAPQLDVLAPYLVPEPRIAFLLAAVLFFCAFKFPFRVGKNEVGSCPPNP